MISLKTLTIYFVRLPVLAYVPYLSNSLMPRMQLFLPRGFSVNVVLLTWYLFGGVLILGFLANFRAMLLMPVFEKPVNSAQDILDRGMIPFTEHVGGFYIDFLKESPSPVYNQLAEISYLPRDNEEFMKIMEEDVHGAGTHVYITGNFLTKKQKELGDYYWSRDILSGLSQWSCWVTNKRWPLNDALAVHLLRMQQVRIFCILYP